MNVPCRRWLAGVLLAVVAVGVAFGLLELALSFLVPPPIVWMYPQESYEYDPKLSHRLRPNQRAFTHSAPVVINSHGLRNEEFARTPAPGAVRILCLGDSLIFGNGVRSSETYPKQLESILNGSGGNRYEVINAGVPGYDTWQEVAYLRDEGVRWAPSVVIVGFYGNDIVPRPAPAPARALGLRDEGSARRVVYWLKRSRVVTLAYERVRRLRNQVRPSPEVIHERALLTGGADSFNEAGFQEVEASFRRLAVLAREHRFEPLIVLFPMPNQLLQHLPHSFYPQRVMNLAAQYAISTLDLSPVFRREFRGLGSLFIEWDGHPNANGYAIAARETAGYVRAITGSNHPVGARRQTPAPEGETNVRDRSRQSRWDGPHEIGGAASGGHGAAHGAASG